MVLLTFTHTWRKDFVNIPTRTHRCRVGYSPATAVSAYTIARLLFIPLTALRNTFMPIHIFLSAELAVAFAVFTLVRRRLFTFPLFFVRTLVVRVGHGPFYPMLHTRPIPVSQLIVFHIICPRLSTLLTSILPKFSGQIDRHNYRRMTCIGKHQGHRHPRIPPPRAGPVINF